MLLNIITKSLNPIFNFLPSRERVCVQLVPEEKLPEANASYQRFLETEAKRKSININRQQGGQAVLAASKANGKNSLFTAGGRVCTDGACPSPRRVTYATGQAGQSTESPVLTGANAVDRSAMPAPTVKKAVAGFGTYSVAACGSPVAAATNTDSNTLLTGTQGSALRAPAAKTTKSLDTSDTATAKTGAGASTTLTEPSFVSPKPVTSAVQMETVMKMEYIVKPKFLLVLWKLKDVDQTQEIFTYEEVRDA